MRDPQTLKIEGDLFEFWKHLVGRRPALVRALRMLRDNPHAHPDLVDVVNKVTTAAHVLLQDSGELTAPPAPAVDPAPLPETRRRRDHSYDYLLLNAFCHQQPLGPIGLDQLFALAAAFDPLTKRASLTAKLNRWRNQKRWITWQLSDDMTLTAEGRAQHRILKRFVLAQGQMARVTSVTETILPAAAA